MNHSGLACLRARVAPWFNAWGMRCRARRQGMLNLVLMLCTAAAFNSTAATLNSAAAATHAEMAPAHTEIAPAQKLIDAAKTQDREAIAKLIHYPLKRMYPLEPIGSRSAMLARFDQVFDAKLLERIAHSNLEQDWHRVGSRGMMLDNGALWLDFAGNIIGINYQTALEATQYAALLAAQKATLPPSLREFERPELMWHTPRFTVRVDYLGQEQYRYAAWAKGKPLNSDPDLLLTSGKRLMDGSGGNHRFEFQSGPYRYLCHVKVIANAPTNVPSNARSNTPSKAPSKASSEILSAELGDALAEPIGELVVYKGGQILLREAAFAAR
ncbi:MAG: hypothetical protein ACRDA8_02685 [Shewanella sp.]